MLYDFVNKMQKPTPVSNEHTWCNISYKFGLGERFNIFSVEQRWFLLQNILEASSVKSTPGY